MTTLLATTNAYNLCNPDPREGRYSSAYIACFSPFGSVVDKEESLQGFILILALVTILFSVSSKLKQNTY